MERSIRATDPNSVSGEAGRSSELHPRCRYIIWPWGFSSSWEVGGPSGPPRIDWIDVVWLGHCRLRVSPSPPLEAGGSFPPEVAAVSCLSGTTPQTADGNDPFHSSQNKVARGYVPKPQIIPLIFNTCNLTSSPSASHQKIPQTALTGIYEHV